jgi:hypothetical protein
MREIGNMVDDDVTQGPLGLRLSASPTGSIPISNRKSGIRIHVKAQEISAIQISNRKYSQPLRSPRRIATFDRALCRSSRFLIYGSAIKTPRNTPKKNTYEFLIGGKSRVTSCTRLSRSRGEHWGVTGVTDGERGRRV